MRPTLERQIEVSKLSDEQLFDAFVGGRRGKIDLWIFSKCHFIWSLIHWNWFCIWCGRDHFRISDKRCKTQGKP